MKLLAVMAGAGVVAGGVQYSGVLDRGAVYAKPYSVVHAELVSMPVPAEARSFVGGEVRMSQAPGTIKWHFHNRQGEIAVFSAHLTREDVRSTRVKVDFALREAVDDTSATLLSTDFMRSTARSAMAEQLDARLSGRAYDNARMGEIFAEHLQDHPEELEQYGHAIGKMYEGVAEQMKLGAGDGTFSHSSSPGYATPSPTTTMTAATRPSIVLTPQ